MMRQTDQEKISGPARQDDKQQLQKSCTNTAPLLTLALQALQNGTPVSSLPPQIVLGLSAKIGNDALLSILMRQRYRLENTGSFPPQHATATLPFQAVPSEPALADPPDWVATPDILSAPAPAGSIQTGDWTIA